MIALLMGLGLGKRVAQLVGYVGLPLVLLGLLWFGVHSWGNSRYHAGRADEAALWKAASDKLVSEAATSAKAADRASAGRVVDFAAKQEAEKDRIDAALENGTSPVDALFPVAAGGVRAN